MVDLFMARMRISSSTDLAKLDKLLPDLMILTVVTTSKLQLPVVHDGPNIFVVTTQLMLVKNNTIKKALYSDALKYFMCLELNGVYRLYMMVI